MGQQRLCVGFSGHHMEETIYGSVAGHFGHFVGTSWGTGPGDDCSVLRQLFLGLFCRGEDY